MVAAQAIDIKPPHQPALNLRVTDSVAFTACVLVSIQSIEQAIKDYDQGALVLALETYKDRHWRAVRAGVKPDTLQEKCKAAHIASVQTSLRCIAKANKNNDVEKRQVAIDGYQHAYDLAIADGIAPSNIKTKCNSITVTFDMAI